MSNLTKDVNLLRATFVSDSTIFTKDVEKDITYLKFSYSLKLLSIPAFCFQLYQISLVNKPHLISTWERITKYKWYSALAALGYGLAGILYLDQKFFDIDRYLSEKTQYQKDLQNEAKLYKLRNEKETTYEEIKKNLNIDHYITYQQFYKLNKAHMYTPAHEFSKPSDFYRRDLPDDEDPEESS